MAISVNIDDEKVLAAFNRLVTSGRNQTRALQAMGRYGKTSTQLRFRSQTGPDGVRWKPSQRVLENGGQTLRLTGRLRNSISWNVTPSGVEWGTNVVYAAAHQFGIDKQQPIRAHFRRGRRGLQTRSGAQISMPVRAHTRHMKLPARPFLGINDVDRMALLAILRRELQQQT